MGLGRVQNNKVPNGTNNSNMILIVSTLPPTPQEKCRKENYLWHESSSPSMLDGKSTPSIHYHHRRTIIRMFPLKMKSIFYDYMKKR